jgi:hypothetical protein
MINYFLRADGKIRRLDITNKIKMIKCGKLELCVDTMKMIHFCGFPGTLIPVKSINPQFWRKKKPQNLI